MCKLNYSLFRIYYKIINTTGKNTNDASDLCTYKTELRSSFVKVGYLYSSLGSNATVSNYSLNQYQNRVLPQVTADISG